MNILRSDGLSSFSYEYNLEHILCAPTEYVLPVGACVYMVPASALGLRAIYGCMRFYWQRTMLVPISATATAAMAL